MRGDGLLAQVRLRIGEQRLTAIITQDAVAEFKLKRGDEALATIPMWITTMLKENELDIAPVGGSTHQWPSPTTRAETSRPWRRPRPKPRRRSAPPVKRTCRPHGGCWRAARSSPITHATR